MDINEKPNFLNFRFFDEIVRSVLTNVLVEHERDGGIYINGYNGDVKSTLYLIEATIASDILQEPVYMMMPLVTYLQFRHTHWKDRKRFRWRASSLWTKPVVTPIDDMMEFVKKEFKIDDDKLLEIIRAYYPKWEDWIK